MLPLKSLSKERKKDEINKYIFILWIQKKNPHNYIAVAVVKVVVIVAAAVDTVALFEQGHPFTTSPWIKLCRRAIEVERILDI
jgi:hypothetical protein